MNTTNNKNNNILFQSVISDKHTHHHEEEVLNKPFFQHDHHHHNHEHSYDHDFKVRNSSSLDHDMNQHSALIKNFSTNMGIGAVAAICGRTLSVPLQTMHPLWNGNSITFSQYIYQCTRGLKTGFGSCLTKFAPAQALALSMKDMFKQILESRSNPILLQNSLQQHGETLMATTNFLAGGLAGATTHCILHPFENAQMRYFTYLSNHNIVSQFKGPVHFVVTTSGFSTLFKGFGIGLMNAITYRGLLFGLYDTLNMNNPFRNQWGLSGFASKLLIAQCATSLSVICSLPFLTVQKEMILNSMSGSSSVRAVTTKELSSMQTMKGIISQRGVSSLFKGAIVECLARRTSGTMILVMYDLLKELWLENSLSLLNGLRISQ